MAIAPFVPLRVFSAYTMLEGAIEPKAIGKYAKGLGFPAVAITDRNGLYGVMPFEDGCRGVGVQPIMGLMLGLQRRPNITAANRCVTGSRSMRRTSGVMKIFAA